MFAQNGSSALMIAAENGHSEVVQCLLDHGAAVTAAREVPCDGPNVTLQMVCFRRQVAPEMSLMYLCICCVDRAGWENTPAARCSEGSPRGGSVLAGSRSGCGHDDSGMISSCACEIGCAGTHRQSTPDMHMVLCLPRCLRSMDLHL